MTPEDVISEVRELIQDKEEPLRYSDEFLLRFVNQTVRRIAILRPDLFSYITTMDCTPGQVIQTAPQDAVRVIEIHSVVGGNGVVEIDKNSLDESYPGWMNDDAGPAVNWVRHVRTPNRFFIYPKAPDGQQLVIEYAQSPKNYKFTEDIDLPDAYFPTVVDGVVYLAESIDNEHVNSGRAQLFQKSFMDSLGTSVKAKIVTDTTGGGEEPEPTNSKTRTSRNTTYG